MLLIPSNVMLNLQVEREHTLPVTMAAAYGDYDHAISGGSWEISLRKKSFLEKQKRQDCTRENGDWRQMKAERERERGDGDNGRENQRNLMSAETRTCICYFTLYVWHPAESEHRCWLEENTCMKIMTWHTSSRPIFKLNVFCTHNILVLMLFKLYNPQ